MIFSLLLLIILSPLLLPIAFQSRWPVVENPFRSSGAPTKQSSECDCINSPRCSEAPESTRRAVTIISGKLGVIRNPFECSVPVPDDAGGRLTKPGTAIAREGTQKALLRTATTLAAEHSSLSSPAEQGVGG